MQIHKRKFGIELEFENTWEYIKDNLKPIIKNIYGPRKVYSKRASFESCIQLQKWHIKLDGVSTITEVTTPVSCLKDLDDIRNVINNLKEHHPNPSRGCGFHVHIDISDIDEYHFMAGWMTVEKAIMECVPDYRRKSVYCNRVVDIARPNKTLVAKILEQKTEDSRHHDAISLEHYQERGTVEIRIAEGTSDGDFIYAWVTFLLHLVEYIKDLNPSRTVCNTCNSINFPELISRLRLEVDTKKFMIDRHAKLN